MHGRTLISALLFTAVIPTSAYSNDVVPDGSTATRVQILNGGTTFVDIAPGNSAGVSLNRYKKFSVPQAGVVLNNGTANATTIINEVVSLNKTNVFGPLTVSGPSAHVVIANPNGIIVDGGSFVNTGNVALITGRVLFGQVGRPNFAVSSSLLQIKSKGLSGVMAELSLISRMLRVNGPISHNQAGINSVTNIVAGGGKVQLSPDRVATTGGWVTSNDHQSSNDMVVDITRAASITSGRIRITVNEKGAGVRVAGTLKASNGDFSLTSTGLITLTGAKIDATEAVKLRGRDIIMISTDRRTRLTSEKQGALINASNNVEIGDSFIRGKKVVSSAFSSLGGVTIIAGRDIKQKGSLHFGPAEIISGESGVALLANDNLSLDGIKIKAAKDILIVAAKKADFVGMTAETDQDVKILGEASVKISNSVLSANQDISIFAADLKLVSGNTYTTLKAKGGAVTVEVTKGDLVNNGALIQGHSREVGNLDSSGGVTVKVAGAIANRSQSQKHLAVMFSEKDDLVITAKGNIANYTGRLFSNAAINIKTGGDFINETMLNNGSSGALVRRKKRGKRSWRSLWLKRKSTYHYSGEFGARTIADEIGLVTAIGDLNIHAENFFNSGGEISADNISIFTDSKIFNSSVLYGSFGFQQSCHFFCSSSGKFNVGKLTGSIQAAENLTLAAAEEIINTGADLIGGNDVKLTSTKVMSQSLLIPSMVTRPSGITGLFQGTRSWLGYNFDGGVLAAVTGSLIFDSESPTLLEGARLIYGDRQVSRAGDPITSNPVFQASFGRRPTGLLWGDF